MSTDHQSGVAVCATHAVSVKVVFHTTDEPRAQAVAAKLIDKAHEIANLPECECDVDVSVETSPPEGAFARAGAGGVPPHGHPPKS